MRFELALDISSDDEADRARSRRSGWHLVDPREVAARSGAVPSVRPGLGRRVLGGAGRLVETRCGWVGDRTVRYLASGKPALVQDTALDEDMLPTGEGLLTFSSVDEAATGAESIVDDYELHCRAARRLAEDVFDSDRVLGALLADVGASP